DPPTGRREKVAVLLPEVTGQSEVASFTHVYVPRNVTKSLYWTVETEGVSSVNPRVAAATPAGPSSAAASAASWAAATNRTRLRRRIPFTLLGPLERHCVDGSDFARSVDQVISLVRTRGSSARAHRSRARTHRRGACSALRSVRRPSSGSLGKFGRFYRRRRGG